ncbi:MULTISPECIES: LLM class flavin-dependent oxidoreductase [Rhizobium]|uniref:Luciferase-like domain-containing protein n=2 Tax=Rhizobium TaxID=379 RepID=A0A109JAZ9_9HYPH|nr:MULTISPECIES: LLM class flavin-dependent oxidoreductase [Rhizobium]KWV45594.1 hypothetical protein AS026_15910 [Rhizobium altiplani]MDQ0561005.1 alkanesulfonate monooxygenase SsuD/methylene tetrahydromethanopterin reductase-like flavin-dependent oxidoreductase (luciferase family) [Rhizobium mesoamericanum]CCM80403.1 putative Luciferase-like monooxygenase [Rhizobium mesoamericanum STM3625]
MANSHSNLTFGIFDHLDDNHTDIERLYSERLELVESCDQLGFYAYHLAEHHCTPHGRSPSPNLFLSSVAQRTRRLRMGPLVLLLPLYHPLRVFEEVCMLDQLSGGRLELGIGRGSLPVELGYFGMSPESAPGCYAETSEILLNAMKGGTLNHHGEHFEFSRIPLALSPHQRPHPPIWIATNRPESARWAAANGANIACIGPSSYVRAVTDAFKAERNKSSDNQVLFRGLLRMVVIGRSELNARSLAASAYDLWLSSFKFLYDLNDLPTPPNLPLTFDEAVENELCVAGTADQVRQTLHGHSEEAGANYLLCQLAFGNLPVEASLYTAATIQSEMIARAG